MTLSDHKGKQIIRDSISKVFPARFVSNVYYKAIRQKPILNEEDLFPCTLNHPGHLCLYEVCLTVRLLTSTRPNAQVVLPSALADTESLFHSAKSVPRKYLQKLFQSFSDPLPHRPICRNKAVFAYPIDCKYQLLVPRSRLWTPFYTMRCFPLKPIQKCDLQTPFFSLSLRMTWDSVNQAKTILDRHSKH
jgi:hypothetical protein